MPQGNHSAGRRSFLAMAALDSGLYRRILSRKALVYPDTVKRRTSSDRGLFCCDREQPDFAVADIAQLIFEGASVQRRGVGRALCLEGSYGRLCRGSAARTNYGRRFCASTRTLRADLWAWRSRHDDGLCALNGAIVFMHGPARGVPPSDLRSTRCCWPHPRGLKGVNRRRDFRLSR